MKSFRGQPRTVCIRFFLFLPFFLLCLRPVWVYAAGQDTDLLEMAGNIGAELRWDSLSGAGVLSKNGHQLSFRTGENLALFDYRTLEIVDAPSVRGGTVYVSPSFVRRAEEFFSSAPAPSLYRVGAILIDPGHGGKDTGAVGNHTVNGKKVQAVEKDITLTIAKDLYNRLSAGYPDKKILLTRTGDTYPTLEERVEMANSVKLDKHEAILYVSVHANAAFDKKASGFEVWYLTPDYRRTVITADDDTDAEILPILNSMMEEEFTTESVLIAKFILDELDREIGAQSGNRGLKEEEWFVVRNANMPSVLIEVGFVSNPEEAVLLNDAGYLRKITTGIYNGLAAFIVHFERSRGFTGTQ